MPQARFGVTPEAADAIWAELAREAAEPSPTGAGLRSEPKALASLDVPYAAWSERFRALLLDIVIVMGALIVVLLALVLPFASGGDPGVVVGAGSAFFFFPLFPAYLAAFHGGARGQTPGKRVLGIAVRHAATLDRISYRRALGRSYLTLLFWANPSFGALGMLDGLWALRDSRRQTLHDKAAKTVVIRMASADTGESKS